jgi:hypothetical protein
MPCVPSLPTWRRSNPRWRQVPSGIFVANRYYERCEDRQPAQLLAHNGVLSARSPLKGEVNIMYIYGDYLLSLVFNLPHPSRVSIYSQEHLPIHILKQRFNLKDEIALDVTDSIEKRTLNIDFWGIKPSANPSTFDDAHPVSTDLYGVSSELIDVDCIRFLALVAMYPWTSIDPHPAVVVRQAESIEKNDVALAELCALKYAKRPFTQLLLDVMSGVR